MAAASFSELRHRYSPASVALLRRIARTLTTTTPPLLPPPPPPPKARPGVIRSVFCVTMSPWSGSDISRRSSLIHSTHWTGSPPRPGHHVALQISWIGPPRSTVAVPVTETGPDNDDAAIWRPKSFKIENETETPACHHIHANIS